MLGAQFSEECPWDLARLESRGVCFENKQKSRIEPQTLKMRPRN
jgi:hypothetical protein